MHLSTNTLKCSTPKRARGAEFVAHEDEVERLKVALAAAEARADALADKLKLCLSSSRLCLFVQDADLAYTELVNPPLGFASDDLIGKRDADLYDAATLAQLERLKRPVIETGAPMAGNVTVAWHGEERVFALNLLPLERPGFDTPGLIGTSIEMTDQLKHETQLRGALMEMSHRTRNQMSMLLSVVRQSGRTALSKEDFRDRVQARTYALALIQDLLVERLWADISLTQLCTRLVGLLHPDTERLAIEGAEVLLEPAAGQALGVAIHELALNAKRHGAWSNGDGRVRLVWAPDTSGSGDLVLRWSETGGPELASDSFAPGFGISMIERALRDTLGTDVDLEFRKTGTRCLVRVPATRWRFA